MADKKLITTTVSSREKGIRRREEGETTSSQRKIAKQGNQEESKKNHMKAEDESPTQWRKCKNDNNDEAKRMEDMRSKGGGRLKHFIVDGDVPLCLRRKLKDSNESRSSKRKTYGKKESRSSTQLKRSIVSCIKRRAEVKIRVLGLLKKRMNTQKTRK